MATPANKPPSPLTHECREVQDLHRGAWVNTRPARGGWPCVISCLASALSQACHLFGTQFLHFLKEEKTSTKGNSRFLRYFCHQKNQTSSAHQCLQIRRMRGRKEDGAGGYDQRRYPITCFSVTCLFHSTLCWNTRTQTNAKHRQLLKL